MLIPEDGVATEGMEKLHYEVIIEAIYKGTFLLP